MSWTEADKQARRERAQSPAYRSAQTAARRERKRRAKALAGAPSIAQLGAEMRAQRAASVSSWRLREALQSIDRLEAKLATYEQFASVPIAPIKPAKLHAGKRPAAAVALLSDVHAEERVERTDAIPNEYSLTIAERRVARFFAGTAWLTQHAAQHDFAIDSLVVWLGGDLISGDIHDELLERCEVPPAEASLAVLEWLVGGFRSLCAALPGVRIYAPCTWGNHSRTTDRVRPATGYGHSWEWLLYCFLARELRDEPRVQVYAPRDEMVYLTVHERELAFAHGHQMRYKGGIGGVTIPAIKAVHRWQEWRECDYYHFGHFHTRLDLGQIAFNGSVIGPSPYGLSKGLSPSTPEQSFYVLDDKRGKTMCCPLWVAE